MPHRLSEMSVVKPYVYHIRVYGILAPDMSDYVRGMKITPDATPGKAPVTDLEGICPDQSGLIGILSALENLGLPVISVEYVGVPEPQRVGHD